MNKSSIFAYLFYLFNLFFYFFKQKHSLEAKSTFNYENKNKNDAIIYFLMHFLASSFCSFSNIVVFQKKQNGGQKRVTTMKKILINVMIKHLKMIKGMEILRTKNNVEF